MQIHTVHCRHDQVVQCETLEEVGRILANAPSNARVTVTTHDRRHQDPNYHVNMEWNTQYDRDPGPGAQTPGEWAHALAWLLRGAIPHGISERVITTELHNGLLDFLATVSHPPKA